MGGGKKKKNKNSGVSQAPAAPAERPAQLDTTTISTPSPSTSNPSPATPSPSSDFPSLGESNRNKPKGVTPPITTQGRSTESSPAPLSSTPSPSPCSPIPNTGAKPKQPEPKQPTPLTTSSSTSSLSSTRSAVSPTKALSQLSLDNESHVHPPQKRLNGSFPGSGGRPCRIQTNHFQMSIKPTSMPNGFLYMYSITVETPWKREYKRSDRPLYQRLIAKWKASCPFTKQCQYSWVYDGGSTLYSTKMVKGTEGKTWTVSMNEDLDEPEKITEFIIKDVFVVKTIAVNKELAEWAAKGRSGSVPHDSVHLLDVLLSQAVNLNLEYTSIGRSYYLPTKGSVLDIGFGKEVWTGLFSSVRPYGWKDVKNGGVMLTLNVDVSNKPATKELHLTNDIGGNKSYIFQLLTSGKRRAQPPDFTHGLDRVQYETVEKDLKGLKVKYELPNGSKRGYRVNSLKEPASTLKIPDLGITVAEYFKKEYKKALKYPKMPCLWLGARTKTIYIPAEMCSMTAQALPKNKALQEEATATMIRGTAVNPLERQKRILDGLKANNNMFQNDPYCREFGISVAGTMANISGRILNAPSLEYANKKEMYIDPKKPGSWQQPRDMQYVQGMELKTWAVIDMTRMDERQYDQLLRALSEVGQQAGLKISSNPDDMWKESVQPYDKEVEAAFSKIVQEYQSAKIKLQLILIILPQKGGPIYDKLKKLGDVQYRVPTQCVIRRNLFKPDGKVNYQVLNNICLKINSKLGGINHVLAPNSRPEVLKRPVMIMGADVTHPAPEQKGVKPSIAAVVASVDPKASKYEVQVRIQASEQNEEVIHDMKDVTKTLLRRFQEQTNFKPQRIVMFRDGVSEGQFLIVLAKELTAIRNACSELEPGYEPKITYLVVQKRHHTRFFPTDNNKYFKNNNALAGTVVDQGINHPTEGDFYLLSHEGIQGTSRPCHYQVLWDDSNMPADQIEILSYYLCHLYARCTRSVSYPTPTYYSHLAADRARKHHNELLHGRENPERAKKIIEEAEIDLMYFV